MQKPIMSIQSGEVQKCLSVVMPAFNKAATLEKIVEAVLKIPELVELIVVDDCSTDATPAILQKLCAADSRIIYLRQEKNSGETAALKSGFAVTKGAIVIIQDADLEYDPREIYDVIAPIIEGHAAVVYGSRFLVKRTARALYFYHYLANKALTFFSNSLTNLNMTGVET